MRPIAKDFFFWIKALVIAIAGVLLLQFFAFSSCYIPSSGMENSLYRGDQIIINKWAYGLRLPFMGLMECVAQTVKQSGGNIIGVIPSKLEESKRVSALPDRFLHTKNLSDRKDIILAESDVMIALPGGIGTLDEVFHEKTCSDW